MAFPGTFVFSMPAVIGGAGGLVGPEFWHAGAYTTGAEAGTVIFTSNIEVDSTGNVYLVSQFDNANYGTDDDAFVITKLNAVGQFQWHKILDGPLAGGADGASVYSKGNNLAIDADDNLIFAQTYRDDRSTTSYNTGFVTKISPEGAIIWQKIQDPSNTTKHTQTYAVTVDQSTNDIYVCGYTNGTGAATGSASHVVKYNSSGTQQWVRIFENAAGSDTAHGIKLDTNGDVLVSGKWDGSYGGFVAKLSKSTGAITWSKSVGDGTNIKQITNMAIDGDDPVMVGYNRQNATATTGYDFWTVKYNNAGTYQWGRLLGGTGSENGLAIETDDSGNVYIGGFNASDLAHTSVTQTLLLAKYNSSGTIQWQKRITADNNAVNSNQLTGIKIHNNSLFLAILSGNGIGNWAIQVMKLPLDDTLWPSTIGDWSIATSALTEKAAATTNGSITYTNQNSGITANDGALVISDPALAFAEESYEISI